MRATPLLVRVGCLLVFACSAGGCGGERIALGDGPELSATPSGEAGQSNGGGPSEPEVPTNDDVVVPGSAEGGSGAASLAGGAAGGATSVLDAGTPILDTNAGGSSDAGSACMRGETEPEQVLFIGDSWLTLPGTQRTHLGELAQAAAALGAGEQYESRAEAATTLEAITEQYRDYRDSEPSLQVVIMDGGTWDTIVSNGSPESISQVVDAFGQFLDEVASDGLVEHVIYFLVPELDGIPGVAELRPGLMAACSGSSVPCHFLDLQPLWEGHPEYTAAGIQASGQGAIVLAENLWAIMQEHCIAQ